MIDSLLQTLAALKPVFGNSALVFSLAIGMTFGLLAFSALYLFDRGISPVRRRLSELELENRSGKRSRRTAKVSEAVSPVRGLVVPKKEKELSKVRTRLLHAGYKGDDVLVTYYAIKICLIIGLAVLAGVVSFVVFKAESQSVLYVMAGAAAFGMLAPSYVLDRKISNRKTEIINAFPDFLDLMVACTEAGLGLNAAIQRVAKETSVMYPVLSSEFEMVTTEMQTGVERTEALKGLSDRTGVEEISAFVSMIRQSVKFGTSIADTLRIYAEEFRDKRMQAAEEKAAKVSTKLIFPLVLCIFPAFFIVAIGPAVLAIIRAFE